MAGHLQYGICRCESSIDENARNIYNSRQKNVEANLPIGGQKTYFVEAIHAHRRGGGGWGGGYTLKKLVHKTEIKHKNMRPPWIFSQSHVPPPKNLKMTASMVEAR